MDIHYALTRDLAEWAGIACPDQLAKWANRPDVNPNTEPESNSKIAAIEILLAGTLLENQSGVAGSSLIVGYGSLMNDALERFRDVGYWHFPMDDDGVVRPASAVSRLPMQLGQANCDLATFGMGIHVFQDSFSHQGRPGFGPTGHGRGVKKVNGGWVITTGVEAAVSTTADDPKIWRADTRRMANMLYQLIVDFKETCPCACRGGRRTSIKPHEDARSVYRRLNSPYYYQGPNRVPWKVASYSGK